jgi:hypothetical protein
MEEVRVHTDKPGGNVELVWSQVPHTHYYRLDVSREGAPFIQSEYVDCGGDKYRRTYVIGGYRFKGQGFPLDSNYHYKIQAYDSRDNIICTEEGNFFR